MTDREIRVKSKAGKKDTNKETICVLRECTGIFNNDFLSSQLTNSSYMQFK